MDIIKYLSAGIKELDATKPEWDESKLHVSDLGVWSGLEQDDRKCPRQLWYRLNGYEKTPPTDGQRLMYLQGHLLEETIIKALRTQGVVEADKIDASFGCIEGEIDMLLRDPETGNLVLADSKTRRGNAFRFNSDIKPAERMQVIGYIIHLQNKRWNVHEGSILEVDREGQNFAREFGFDMGAEEILAYNEAKEEMNEIKSMKEPPSGMDATLIEKENKGKNSLKLNICWQCRWCSYADTCCDYVPSKEIREKHGKVVGHIIETDEGETKDIPPEYRNFEIKE